MTRLHQRFIGLLASLGLLAALTGVPVLLVAIDAIPDLSTFSWARLRQPDDGTLALTVATIAVWILWVVFTGSVLLDVGARMRHIRAPRLPGMAVPQLAARRLVGLAALLFVAIPTVTAIAITPRAVAVGVAPASLDQPTALTPQTPSPVAVPAPAEAPAIRVPAPRTDSYTVQRGDSLWKIAKSRLGDGTRFTEIKALNRHVLGEDADFLLPGTVLQIPHVDLHPGGSDETYVVEAGDTLSSIAQDELGNSDLWPRIAAASATITQPGGEHLTDPDLIKPGWQLEVPATRTHHQMTLPHLEHGHPGEHTPQASTAPPSIPASPSSAPTQPAEPGRTSSGTPQKTADQGALERAAADAPAWLLPGLTGAGAALAGVLLLVVRQHRRTQLRFREPGHIIKPPPAQVLPAEKTAQAIGSLVAPRIELLENALKQLATASGAATPALITTTLADDAIAVRLARAAKPRMPWIGNETNWSIAGEHVAPDATDAAAPYPFVVSTGVDDAGLLVYLNLEDLRAVAITGDPERAAALGRHIAAELALNPWSTLVEIETLGIAAELADIDPYRLHHHPDGDGDLLDQLADNLETEDPALEPDRYRALIVTNNTTEPGALDRITRIITTFPGRVGAIVLTIGGTPAKGTTELRVDSDGHLSADFFDTTVVAAGLTEDEARGCALLVSLTRDAENAPMPTSSQPDAVADQGGALLPNLTLPRPDIGPAGEASLLPLAPETYEAASATTTQDVRQLAPLTAPETSTTVTSADPTLDTDLTYWHSEDVTAPKLSLLGPVRAQTSGVLGERPHRIPFRTEILTLLALHRHGLTLDEICGALRLGDARVRKDLSLVRKWLGGPDAQHLYLPDAREIGQGAGRYIVRDIICDLDLFRRLRARGQSRGAAGIDDLRLALNLVTGEPFSDLRPNGWGWLLDGDRHDHIAAAAIVDTAHIVTTHALTVGDLDLAGFAAQKGYVAAPYEETPRLDLIAVDQALGAHERAEDRLQADILNRSDDDLGPIEPPERTTRIVRQRGWDQKRWTG
ncbi:MAG: LysM peptidoglycan-binding domain-containing protein [Solirubrobacteraceae bacterium]